MNDKSRSSPKSGGTLEKVFGGKIVNNKAILKTADTFSKTDDQTVPPTDQSEGR